jgi:hypothetical protein
MMLFGGGAVLTVGEVADRCGLGPSTASSRGGGVVIVGTFTGG